MNIHQNLSVIFPGTNPRRVEVLHNNRTPPPRRPTSGSSEFFQRKPGLLHFQPYRRVGRRSILRPRVFWKATTRGFKIVTTWYLNTWSMDFNHVVLQTCLITSRNSDISNGAEFRNPRVVSNGSASGFHLLLETRLFVGHQHLASVDAYSQVMIELPFGRIGRNLSTFFSRIHFILKNDEPLPRHFFTPNSSGERKNTWQRDKHV